MKNLLTALLVSAFATLSSAQTLPNPVFGSVKADISLATVTVSGAARTTAQRATDAGVNALDSLKGDCSSDDSAKLTSLLAAASAASSGGNRVRVYMPAPPGGCYALASAVALPSNVDIQPVGKVILRATGSSGAIFTATSVSNIGLGGFVIDQQKSIHTSIAQVITANSVSQMDITGVTVVNPSGGFVFTASDHINIDKLYMSNGLYNGVQFIQTHDSSVTNCEFQNLVDFGVIIADGSYKNLVQGNKTTSNGIELVGVVRSAYQNRIIGNHAEGTGDNCISITGYENIVSANEAIGCAGNGIEVYGNRNVVVGNYAKNNAKGGAGNSGWDSGIRIQGAFGGVGSVNVVANNVLDDDQATPTQKYGVSLYPPAYSNWASGVAVTSGAYVLAGTNTYLAQGSGTTGGTAPTCTSGTCSDGGVTWIYCQTFPNSLAATQKNEYASNNVYRYGTAQYLDNSGNSSNESVGGFNGLTIPANTVFPSTVAIGTLTNLGSVTYVTKPSSSAYNFTGASLNGALPTVSIAAPASGAQATAQVNVLFLWGFGTAAGGAGCSVNDVLTIQGGTPAISGTNLAAGTPLTIKVLTLGSGGSVATFTAGPSGSYYYTHPWPATTTLTGGTCTTSPTLTGTVWQIGADLTVTNAGSGYGTPPAVTYTPANSVASSSTVVTVSGQFVASAGVGKLLLDSTGTKIGNGTSPVITQSPVVNGTCQRVTLTTSGYTVPAATDCVRLVQATTVATSTITLPTALLDGQVLQFVNYAGAVTALTFSPAVLGWTNASAMAAYTGMRVRWDSTSAAWIREQ